MHEALARGRSRPRLRGECLGHRAADLGRRGRPARSLPVEGHGPVGRSAACDARRRSGRSRPALPRPATGPPPPWIAWPRPRAKRRGRRGGQWRRAAGGRDRRRPPGGHPVLHLALKWPAAEVPAEDRDWVRYYLAYLHYKAGDLAEAAAAAEDLARQDPRHPQARRAAKIALAACTLLFNQAATAPQRRAAGQRMTATAEFIVRHWQDEPEAELIAGQAAWSAWVEAWRGPSERRPPPAEMDLLLDRARQLLTAGVQPARQRRRRTARSAPRPPCWPRCWRWPRSSFPPGTPTRPWPGWKTPKIGPRTWADAGRAAMPPELAEET